MATRKTNEEFKAELYKINPNILPLEKYVNARTKMQCKCLLHNIVWSTTPQRLLYGCGCKRCTSEKISNSNKTSREDYISQLKEKFEDKITLLSDYTKISDKMQFKCNICGHIWVSDAFHLLRSGSCPKCAGRVVSTAERISIIESFGKVTVLEKIFNMTEKIKVKCNFCGHIFYGYQYLLVKGSGCKKCSDHQNGISLRKSHEQFVQEMAIIHPELKVLSQYVNAITSVQCLCIICGNIWDSSTADSLLHGNGCPRCALSNGEKRVCIYMLNHKILYTAQKKFPDLFGIGGGQLSYDFFIPHYNLLIECQGEQHFEPVEYFGGIDKFKKQQEHDQRKREYAQNHNINLLEIRYDQNVNTVLDEYFQTYSPLKRYTKIQPISRIKINLNLESVETVIPT